MSIDDRCDNIRSRGKNKNEVGYASIKGDIVELNTRLENGGVLHSTIHLCPQSLLDASKNYQKEMDKEIEARRKSSFGYRALKFLGIYKE